MIDFFHKSAAMTKKITGTAKLKGTPVVHARSPWRITAVGTFYDEEDALRSILLEVSDTEESRRKGLMGRKVVPSVCGMLFRGLSGGGTFWMKGCLVPIDVAFLRKNGTISKIYTMQADGGKKRYEYDEEDVSAVETAAGFFSGNGIVAGFKLKTRSLSRKEG